MKNKVKVGRKILPEFKNFEGHISKSAYRLEIDLNTAERLISDKMAKILLYKWKRIKTRGKKDVSIGLDKICEAFCDGERIDVNVLKSKGLVPHNALRVKIVGTGEINKAFAVFANRFTKGAIKMIALAGGVAVQVKSKKIRRPVPNCK